MSKIFTIIIPVYKVEKYIGKCLESVLEQSFSDFEAICVDDCGGDKSVEIIREFMEKDNRIKLIQHSKNRGLSAARNTALEAAQGEYIVCLDSDDWLETNCLEVLYREFKTRGTNSIWFDAYKYNNSEQKRENAPVLGNNAGYMEITPDNICACSDYSWIKAYKTSSIKDNNLYWPEGLTFEDGEFYFKYFSLNPKTYIIENCLYNYRIREGSIVTNAQAGNVKLNDIYQIVRNIRDFYIKQGLYDKYKKSILQLLNMRINTCKNICNNYHNSLKLSKEIMKDFGYPIEFSEFKPAETPVFSVIVPVYNVEKYIEKCIRSIQTQTFNNFEILCVDDCGQDNSIEIIKEMAKDDSRIKILKHRKNKGLGAARNTALRAAQGEYIICVDSDDWLMPDCLETVYNTFKQTGLNAIWYKANIWWEDANCLTDLCIFPEFRSLPEGYYTLDDSNLLAYPMYAWNKAYRKKFILENKLLWSEGVLFEDVEFGVKAGIFAPEIYVLDKNLYVYRRRGDSIIGNCINNVDKAKDIFVVSSNLYKYLKKNKLFEKYKNSFMRHAVDNINMFRGYSHIQKKLALYIKQYLENIEV